MENVIYRDDEMIGYRNDIIKAFKTQLADEILDEEIEKETLQEDISEILEIIQVLENECDNYTLLAVKHNSMGAYYYEKIEY